MSIPPLSTSCRTLIPLTLLMLAPSVSAQSFARGNALFNTTLTNVPGQSFSPAVASTPSSGNVGNAPASGSVVLLQFSIGYEAPDSINVGGLYIFDREYTGTPEALETLTVGTQGLIGRSLTVQNAIWSFGTGLILPDVSATYFAYSDVEGEYRLRTTLIEENSGPDYGDTDLQAFYADNRFVDFSGAASPDEDIVFQATYATAVVPSPNALMLMLFGIAPATILLRRRQG